MPDSKVDVDYTYLDATKDPVVFSTIDHIAVSEYMSSCLNDAGVIHDGANLSNHSPIYAKFNVGAMDLQTSKIQSTSRTSWIRANEDSKENFKEVFRKKLDMINYEHQCWDIHCNSQMHSTQLELYTLSVLEAMESAADESLPRVYQGDMPKRTKFPGWKEYVGPYADESRFWHSLWSSAGKPRSGELYSIMKSKKGHYKYAVRRLKRCTDLINNDKLIKSLLSSDQSIFEEVKKLRKKPHSISNRIDDKLGPELIATHFSDVYQKLYNNVAKSDSANGLYEMISGKLGPSSLDVVAAVDVKTVRTAIGSMKSSKSDSSYDVTSDLYRNSPDDFYEHLTVILQQSLIHGSLPGVVLLCTLMPLVKNSLSDITKSDNYRAIAGGCLLLKVLDLVILNIERDKLDTDALQFAYKANTGTTTCTWTVTAVVDHFSRGGRNVFGAAMDMSKAFDMVKWSELFNTLLDRQISPVFLRLLLYIYTNQQYIVKWGNTFSASFSVSNGVRQGGVTSGIFFCNLY